MLKQNILLGVTMALALATYSLYAQQAAEIFIPIGKSPGISKNRTIIGKIEALDAQNQSFTISNSSGTYTVNINTDTKIWRDNSKLKKTNQIGSVNDCQPGRRAEVNYAEPERIQTVTGEWIKVEMADGEP